ncbi:hypothetical protein [Kitasatospora sp. NPDC097643]|uniref:hypothetical protein n=1 Tax=Kitasatospora sp. NPDC097643 TaxID=3157230 RepID=UPI0033333A6A
MGGGRLGVDPAMNDHAAPLGAWQGPSRAADTPAAPDRHILRALHVASFGNRCFAQFGLVGGPVVLGAQSVHWEPGRLGGAGLLGLAGLECYDGFQRLVTIAHVSRELPPAELAKAVLWIVVATGDERHRIRELCDEAAHRVNLPVPQDDLSRCRYLLAVQDEFRREGATSTRGEASWQDRTRSASRPRTCSGRSRRSRSSRSPG